MIIGDMSVICILSEFIRREETGSTTIIGTYHHHFQTDAFPFYIPIGAYIQITPPPPAGTNIIIEGKVGDEGLFKSIITTPKILGAIDEFSSSNLAISGGEVEFSHEAVFTITLTIDDHDPKVIARLAVLATPEA